MKQFNCGAVTDDDILRLVAQHAGADHGVITVPDELVNAVRANIHEYAA
jgi:predicted small metal-binding protein